MPLFLTEEEFRICSNDPLLVASKADEFIVSLRRQMDTAVAEADAASVTAEQTYNVLEQRYASLSAEIGRVQAENEELAGAVEKKAKELAEVQNVKLGNEAVSVSKDGEIERLKVEVLELRKSKRQLLELMTQKDEEIEEKNATIQSYLDKIVKLTEDFTKKEVSMHGIESELARCEATCSRLSQEKELIEKHNIWFNDELNGKINSLSELRKMHIDFEEDMTNKLADVERNFNEASRSLKQSEEKSQEYLAKITSMEEELMSSKNALAIDEVRYMSELSTVSKLVELYKVSSEEWSKKAGELEGVIKALEIHLTHVENDYKDKLEKELSARKEFEKDAENMKEKLQKYEIEFEKAKTSSEAKLLQLSNIDGGINMDDMLTDEAESDSRNDNMCLVAPKAPMGISGTALAASLLRDGWTLAKMYEKYHEAADALRHERWGRKHAESILERVLREIEQKAETIFEERAEHEKIVDSYSSLNQKLQQSLIQTDTYETAIRTLKAELKKHDRDHTIAQKEISDLQKQITVLMKECRDAQIRCGVKGQDFPREIFSTISADSDDTCNINDLTFKDIAELVQQNSHLRNLVHNLSNVEQTQIVELKENFKIELQKKNEAAANKVEAVLKRCEEQEHMIESLHGSVSMYKRLYEEQSKIPSSDSHSMRSLPVTSAIGEAKKDILLLFEGSQESAKVAHKKLAQLNKSLEEDLTKSRSEVMELRIDHDKINLEAKFAREKFESFMKDLEYQRDEANGVRARNVELSQLLLDYQRRFRESSDLLRASEDLSRKLSVEISILKNENEILKNAEKRATDEVISLSERVQRVQSSLDTIHSVEEVREESRLMERSKHEGHIKQIEKEWADVKKELQEERDHVRILKSERERAEEDLKQQLEQIRKELSDSQRAVSFAQTRAAVAEARLFDLEKLLKSSNKVVDNDGLHIDSAYTNNEGNVDLCKLRDEMEKLKEEALANNDYMTQYKEIARTNEVAMKQIELSHQEFKSEAEKVKSALESELLSFKEKYSDLENHLVLKSAETLSAIADKENAFFSTLSEITHLQDECSLKMAKITELETETYSLKEALDAEHERWRSAQNNYERQVILQSETIQELNKTSVAQASLQDELKELRKCSDSLKVENGKLNASWQSEKSILLCSKEEAERKYKETEEQNIILHGHLEALHIKLGDKDLTSTAGKTAFDSTGYSKLQSVINYLRHAKEIANTEVMLLRQEKLRLQSQLESALKASERAQALLQSDRENAKAISFTDDDFKSLQFQVREINLLRESNAQLREENKHNFQDCEKLHEIVQKNKLDGAQLVNEKDVALDGCQKEINTLKEVKGQLEVKIEELLGMFERLKHDIKQHEVKLKERESEIEILKNLLLEKQESISNFEQELAKYRNQVEQQQKKISDSLQIETTLKSDIEKHRKMAIQYKKRWGNLTKEKEELSNENHNLQKQLEDYKSSKKADAQMTNEDAIKVMEKDTRIQILEKTLEREREVLRKEKEINKKEKTRQMKTENTVIEHVQKIWQERKKLLEEIRLYKIAICNVLEGIGITANQLPPECGLDEQTVTYFFSVSNFEETVNATHSGVNVRQLVADSSLVEAALDNTDQQFSRPPAGIVSHHDKSGEVKEKVLPKMGTDPRKTVRRIIRPRLEKSEDVPLDSETLDIDSSTAMEVKVGEPHEEPPTAVNLPSVSLSRKRLASSSVELKEDIVFQPEPESEELSRKKSKVTESLQEVTEKDGIPSSENVTILSPTEDVHDTTVSQLHEASEQGIENIGKDEKLEVSNIGLQDEASDPMYGSNETDEAVNEFETILETVDEIPKGDDEGQELHQPMILSEDDHEEGELALTDQEAHLEEGEFQIGQGESISGDAGGSGALETAVVDETYVEDLNEVKPNDATSTMDEVVEVFDKILNRSNQSSVDHESSSTLLQSSNITADKVITEQLPQSAAIESDESMAGGGNSRNAIADRARQNSLLRQAAMSTSARGPGRTSRARGRMSLGRRGIRGRGRSNDGKQG